MRSETRPSSLRHYNDRICKAEYYKMIILILLSITVLVCVILGVLDREVKKQDLKMMKLLIESSSVMEKLKVESVICDYILAITDYQRFSNFSI